MPCVLERKADKCAKLIWISFSPSVLYTSVLYLDCRSTLCSDSRLFHNLSFAEKRNFGKVHLRAS